jgi:hypothetical protein
MKDTGVMSTASRYRGRVFLIVSDCGATARSSAVDTISLGQTQAFDEAAAQID